MKRQFLLFGVLLILFSACKKQSFDAPKQATIDDDKIKAYIAANHIDVTKDPATGIYYKIVTTNPSTNHPTSVDTVQVTYTGTFLNGTIFQPTSTSIAGVTEFIPGWQIVLPLMTANGAAPYCRVRLIVPSALGYGTVAQPDATVPIPANAILDFTIDLRGFYGPQL